MLSLYNFAVSKEAQNLSIILPSFAFITLGKKRANTYTVPVKFVMLMSYAPQSYIYLK